jgi:hypothetical protein
MDKLQESDEDVKNKASELFNRQHFCRNYTTQTILKLDEEMQKVCSLLYQLG